MLTFCLQLFPADLKLGVRDALNALLKPIREAFSTPEMKALVARAYPTDKVEAKQVAAPEKRSDKPAKASAVAGGASAVVKNDNMDISRVDMRVGLIVSVEKHPDADSLYIEKVDLGEAEPRTVISGLVKHMPAEALKGRLAVFVCNLKPAVRTFNSFRCF